MHVKKKHAEISLEGEVLDTAQRHVTRHGNSDHVSIPQTWKKLLKGTILEISLVKDHEGEISIVCNKPKTENA